MIKERKRI